MFEVARIMLGTQKMLMLSIVDDCDGLNMSPTEFPGTRVGRQKRIPLVTFPKF